MIRYISLFIFLGVVAGSKSYAQSDHANLHRSADIGLDGSSSIKPKPLFIIEHKGKSYVLDSAGISEGVLKPEYIEALHVIKKDVEIYGEQGRGGVVLVTLKEDKYPRAFKEMKKYLSKAKYPAKPAAP